MTCESCGATYADADDDCRTRFDALLALDHSHREPWGSRHGLAFSAFVLQHPDGYAPGVLDRAWQFLYAVYVRGGDRAGVARALRRAGRHGPGWDAPSRPTGPPRCPFDTTIADLGTFPADSYATRLDAWCRSALAGWSSRAVS